MRIAGGVADEAMITSLKRGVRACRANPVQEWLKCRNLRGSMITGADKPSDGFPRLVGGHGRIGQGNGGILGRQEDERTGGDNFRAGVVRVKRSKNRLELAVVGKGLIQGGGSRYE